MTTGTLPSTPRVGLSLVHQPTTRHTMQHPTTARPTPVTVLRRRLAAWWRRLDGPELGWSQERQVRHAQLYPDTYTWILRSTR